MKNLKNPSIVSLVAMLILSAIFSGYQVALAVKGEGSATIDGGGNATVERAVSHTFTVILTVGPSGITDTAANPTFTIPAGFTTPNASPVATKDDVVSDGQWSAIGGATCPVTMGSSSASGQVIMVDVTTTCTVGLGGKITLTYRGKSAVTMGATALTIMTADDTGVPTPAVSLTGGSPTITVTDTIAPTVTITMNSAAFNIGSTALVTFTFSEPPVGFTTADVTVGNGTIGAIDASNPLIQTATYTPTNGAANATNVITVGTAWTDAALNAGIGSSSPNYTVNTVASSSGNPQQGTITVIKTVINDNGGTKTVTDFPLFVNGKSVVSGVTNTYPAPAAAYAVTETSNSNYTRAFSGACDSNGYLGLSPGDQKICVITNDDKGAPAVSPVPPLIDVVKTASPLALPNGPGPVTYTYTLHNIGTVPVINITMVGDTCSPITLVSGDTNADGKLDVNETWVYHCSTRLSATHTNIVTTTGWANGISAIDIASATVVVGTAAVPPLIHVTKVPNPLTLSAGGGNVTYTEKVSNPGTVALSTVTLSDDKCSPVTYVSGDTNNDKKLDVNETWVYTCQSNLDRSTTNTATGTGSANGMTATDFAIATVLVAAPGLPNTGLPPYGTSVLWFTVVLVGVLIVGTVMCLRKRKYNP